MAYRGGPEYIDGFRHRHTGLFAQAVRKLEIRQFCRLTQGTHNAVLKFEGACCGCNDRRGGVPCLTAVSVIDMDSDGCVRIDDISVCLIEPADRGSRLLLRGITAFEQGEAFLHLISDGIGALFTEILHKSRRSCRIVSADVIDQTLQIRGDQDVHRRRAGQDEVAVPVIGTCSKEIKQDFVGIGSAQELRDRQPHP